MSNPRIKLISDSRGALISAVFQRLDLDRDELLSPHEMRRFAELTGFGGGEDEWKTAFKTLMSENGVAEDTAGVDFDLFAKLVEDKSADTGCHCNDNELRSMLDQLLRVACRGLTPSSALLPSRSAASSLARSP